MHRLLLFILVHLPATPRVQHLSSPNLVAFALAGSRAVHFLPRIGLIFLTELRTTPFRVANRIILLYIRRF